MTTYVIGCDNIDKKEQSYIDKVAQVLEEAGNTCEKLSVGPGNVQSCGLSSNSNGKTGVFLVGGNDGGTYQDFVQGLSRGYYHYDLVWFGFCSWTAHSWITPEDLKNKPMVRAHDDNFSTSTTGFVGKTAAQYFSENSQYIKMAYGNSPEAVAKMILNGGGDDDDKSSSASTIKEALKELLSYWDGDVECRVEGDTCYVHKIPEPTEEDSLKLSERLNLLSEGISVHDYFPDTTNKLTVTWPNGEPIIFTNDKLITRFGEKSEEVEAVKKVTVTETKEVNSTDTTSTDTDTTDTTDDTTSTDTTGDTTETETTTKTEEVPVETYEEALAFANNYWHKILRDDGHSLECKVIGGPIWKQGLWVKVYIPTYDIDDFMYISKVNHSSSDNDVWSTSLTLVDYPPSLSEPKEETTDEETTDETEESTEDVETTE
ncbi:hypothetical protein [uncultured Methanobrevibacter sp.]|uniref:hypothetical protein n=1 Tax=uncultured Methanobrevibacter sp. TaxID=253161 RepID=UPI00262CA0D7|nr:hypothetical protein [uncultured Methanobrevibacter sp.]